MSEERGRPGVWRWRWSTGAFDLSEKDYYYMAHVEMPRSAFADRTSSEPENAVIIIMRLLIDLLNYITNTKHS